MRNSAPGRCRYIRERSQPTASLLFFPGFLSGIRPAETNGPNDGRRTRHDIRCDQASNQATSVRPGEQHPTVARRQTYRRMRRADRHLKNGILAGQTATRSGLSGNGPDRFLLSGAPADNDPPLPNGARNRSLAVTATYSLPADTMQTRRPKHGKRIKMANNRRHSHRELIRSPAVIRGCRPRSSIPTPTLTGKLVRRQNPTTDTIRRKSDTEIKRHATATNTCGQKLPNRTDHSAKLLSKFCSIR